MISFAGGLVLGYVIGSVITAVLIFGLWHARGPKTDTSASKVAARESTDSTALTDLTAPSPSIDLRDPDEVRPRRRRGFHLHDR